MAASDVLAAVDRAQVGDWDRGNEGIREQVLRNEPDTPEEELPEMDDLPFLVRLVLQPDFVILAGEGCLKTDAATG